MPVRLLVDGHELIASGGRFISAQGRVPVIMDEEMMALRQTVREIAVRNIRAVTPVASGQLRDSTEGLVMFSGRSIRVDVSQHRPTKDGKWDIGRIIREGRRALVIEASPGHYLYWPGAQHPVKRVKQKAREPNPYQEKALAPTAAETRAALGDRGWKMIGRIMEAL